MMDICHIPRRFVRSDWGGTETAILETCKRLIARGHRAEVVCSNALAERDEEEIEGVHVRRYPYFYPYIGLRADVRAQMDRVGGNLFSFSLMRALMRMPDVDVFHVHTTRRLGGIVRAVARKRGVPYVVSLHGGWFDAPEEEFERQVTRTKGALEWGKVLGWWVGSRKVLDDAGAIICVGGREAELVRERFPGKRVEYLPHGVDAARFEHGDGVGFRAAHGIGPKDRVVLNVARISTQKNQLLAVRAMPELLRRDPHVRLVLIGPVTSEAYLEEIHSEAATLGVAERVAIIPGYPPGDQRLVDAYHAADVFLLPSVHEPFGIVILEAWAANLPVLAAKVGGIPYFVEDGKDGVLFDPHSTDDLVRAYDALGSCDVRGMAAAGKEKVLREYTWERVVDRLLKVYEEVVTSPSASRWQMS
jgi:glycosyltransferase involved in cell wall biosynthesis